jgi:hypothetical protein
MRSSPSTRRSSDDGIYLDVAPDAVVEGLVHIVYVTTASSTPVMTHPRT